MYLLHEQCNVSCAESKRKQALHGIHLPSLVFKKYIIKLKCESFLTIGAPIF